MESTVMSKDDSDVCSNSVWEIVRDVHPPSSSASSSSGGKAGPPSSHATLPYSSSSSSGSAAIYYYNKITGVTTAEKPEELKTDEERFRDANLHNQSLIEAYARNPELLIGDTAATEGGSNGELGEGNVGFQMLRKLGWKDTSAGLGKQEQGIVAPITLRSGGAGEGLGVSEKMDEALAAVTRERKRLDVEIEQSEETKRRRVENAEREAALQSDLKCMNREFYCDICDKQYKNVTEMSSHLSSYDHHHKKRFKEMKQSLKEKTGTGGKNDREAIRQREERELEREMQNRLKAMEKAQPQASSATSENNASVGATVEESPKTVNINSSNSESTTSASGENNSVNPAVVTAAPVPQVREKVSFSMGFKAKK